MSLFTSYMHNRLVPQSTWSLQESIVIIRLRIANLVGRPHSKKHKQLTIGDQHAQRSSVHIIIIA